MRWRRAILDALDVRPEEGRLVAVLLAHSFLIGVPRILTSTVAMALFLGSYQASALPWVYVGAAATIPLVGFLRLRLSTRLGLGALLATDLVAVIVMLLVFRAALGQGDARIVALLLPIWYEVEWVLLNLEFWGLASQLFNVRQGKRLFGLIGSGELLAGGLAGALAPTLVARVGTENLLLVSAGSVALCLAMLFSLRRRLRARPAPASEDRLQRRGRFADLLRSRYLTLLFGLVALSYLGYYVVDNCFYSLAHARLPGEDELASFLGVFWGAVSFVTLGSRALLSRRILSRYGLVGGLLALPAALAAGASLVALSGAVAEATTAVFVLMALTKLFDQTLRESVDRSAILVLYQPLPTGQRVRAQTAVEGIVGPAAGGLSGLTLLLLVQGFGFGPVQLAPLLLVVIAGWALVAVRVRREYTDVLARALSGRRLGGLALELGDASSLAVIDRGLTSSHPGEIVYCLGVLEELRHPSLPAQLERLINHPAAEVRRDVAQRVERLALNTALSAVRGRVASEPDPAVRGAAIKALCAVGEPADLELAMGLLAHPEADVRLGALSGLLRHGGIEGVLAAGGPLSRMTEASDAAERCLAARLIGEVGVASFYRPLLRLLEDPEPVVRRAALEAAARVSNPRLLPAVLGQLRDPRLRSAAMAAVGAAGEAALPQLDSMLLAATRSRDLVAQRRLLRLAGRVRGPRAVEFLWKHLEGASPELRHTLLGELVLLGFHAGAAEEPQVRALLDDEVREAAEVVAAIDDVAELGGLISSTLEGQLDRARERLFSLLAFLYPADTVARARVSLCSRSPEKRAQAVELIDSLLSLQLSDLVVPLLEDVPHAARLQRLAVRFPVRRLPPAERLSELLGVDFNVPWTRACAVEAAGRAGLLGLVERGTQDPDPLVRETAAWAAKQGDERMLSTVEKVMILKSVSIFAHTPDDVLAEVASLLEEIEVGPGEVVFERGDMGAALYIVIEGSVRVTSPSGLNVELGAREIFGEMAALDPEPRSATVTATEPTRLFRLEQESLYDLMADRIEVVRGVIRVLCHRLRAVT